MADTYTLRARLTKIEFNTSENSWGTKDSTVKDLVDEALGGVESVSLTAGNVTLTANDGASDQARNPIIILTGTPGTTRTVTFPNVEGWHFIINNSDSTATLTSGAGTTVSLLSGYTIIIYTDGATNTKEILGQSLTRDANDGSSFIIKNTNSGTAANSGFVASNGTTNLTSFHTGAGFAASGIVQNDGSHVRGNGTGGLAVYTSVGSTTLRFGVNNTEVGRFDSSAVAGNTRFLVYDVDNGTLERVSVGAADSGGSGFKVLRIPN